MERERRRRRRGNLIHRGVLRRSDERRMWEFALEVLRDDVGVGVPGVVVAFDDRYLALWADLQKPEMDAWKEENVRGNERRRERESESELPVGLVGNVDELLAVGEVLLLQREQHSLAEWTCH